MPRRLRQHINPLKQTALVPREPLRVPCGPSLEVELGCGDGVFMVERARHRRERLFVGLDIRSEFLVPGQRRIAELGLTNVRLETCNLSVDAAHLFPEQRVDTFWVNFPDPWFKRRQQNRRWLDADVLRSLVRALRPLGRIVYQTDVWDLALQALGLLEANDLLRNRCGAFSFSRQRLAAERTSREKACEAEGRRIWRLEFVAEKPATP